MNQYLFMALFAVGLLLFSIIVNLFVTSKATPKCKYVVQVDYDGMIKNHPAINIIGYNDTDMKAYFSAISLNGKEAEEAIAVWEKNPKAPKQGYCVTYKDKNGELSRVFYDSTYPYKGCEVGKWWFSIFGIKKDHMRLIYKNYGNNSAAYPGKSQDEQAPDKEFDALVNTHALLSMIRTLKESTFPVIAIILIAALVVLGVVAYRELSPPNVVITNNQTANVTK